MEIKRNNKKLERGLRNKMPVIDDYCKVNLDKRKWNMGFWKKISEEEPDENELVLIAIEPDIITLGTWDGKVFRDANGRLKAKKDEIFAWQSSSNPWKEFNSKPKENIIEEEILICESIANNKSVSHKTSNRYRQLATWLKGFKEAQILLDYHRQDLDDEHDE